ncbi:isoprenylcysteine carboxylmethyltransferase family protein [Phenylobacterium sp.]|uniref:methyltransferase family protein n=1 Tax=Phenylobacterium sp. TaxID=1871053 RepID=UPI002ED8932B
MFGRAIAQTAVIAVLFGLMLFFPAGRLDWPQAWVFIVLFVVTSVAMAYGLARTDPALLKERTSVSGGRGLRGWDRVFFTVLLLGVPAWFIAMGWEARLNPPAWGWPVQAVGGAMALTCMAIAWRTFRENSFAAPAVQVQTDRQQHVIDTGPYAVVRHPLYAGATLWMLGTPMLLGSRIGLVGGAAMILLVALRSIGEERVLSKELAGYDDYRHKVRFRLLPGVW